MKTILEDLRLFIESNSVTIGLKITKHETGAWSYQVNAHFLQAILFSAHHKEDKQLIVKERVLLIDGSRWPRAHRAETC